MNNNTSTRSRILLTGGVFLVTFLYLFFVQYSATFPDPDSFYHMKLTLLMRENGVLTEFPWLPYTTLADAFIDQHFLYHVFLIPFTFGIDPLIGGKLATVFLTSVAVTVFYVLLRRYEVRWPLLWTGVLLVTNPFVFRASLAKAFSLSLIFLLVGLWLLSTERRRWLAVLAFAYVWSYGGFSLLLVVVGISAAVGFIADLRRGRRWSPWTWLLRRRSSFREHWERIWANRSVRTVVAVLIGTIAGILINPYFPENLAFYWYQVVEIGIVNYRNIIGVGAEWYPYAFIELISNTVFVTISMLLGVVFLLLGRKRQDRRSIVLLLLAVFFFALTLRSRRFVEYYVPFGTLFGAYATTKYLQGVQLSGLRRQLKDFYWQRRVVTTLIAIYMIVTIPAIVVRDAMTIRRQFENGLPIDKFAHAMSWLRENSEQGDFVLHSDWDEFPILFYRNDRTVYTAGLDATFFYVRDPDRYWEWVNITRGESPDLLATLQRSFNARYVFLETDHTAMDALMSTEPALMLVYEDTEAKIYEVPKP